VNVGDVYKHVNGNYIKIAYVKKIGADVRIYMEGPKGSKSNLTERQFNTPDRSGKPRYTLANNDHSNPWRK